MNEKEKVTISIVTYPNKLLNKKSEDIVTIDDSTTKLAKIMALTIRQFNGIGLSAIQIGIPKNIIVINVTGKDSDNLVLINPVIVSTSEEQISLSEGCLSIPDIYVNIKRPRKVKVAATSLNGERSELEFDGLAARAVQHEVDHLTGVLLLDKLGGVRRHMIEDKLKKLRNFKAPS